jgi:alpha/beta hydrolase family protein
VPERWVVLPSPLLGPVAYEPLAAALRHRGHTAVVAECPEPIEPDRLVAEWSRTAEPSDVLVAHSNAGYLAPVVSASVGGPPVLFMDAALPPAEGTTQLALPDFLETLRRLAGSDGRLPRWTRWWPAEQTAEVLPGPWFGRVDSAAPRLPLTYFETEITAPEGWTSGPCAYLAFGTTYADEVAFARDRGWPVVELAGHHLWHLEQPEQVAEVLARLLSRLSGSV